MLDVFGYPVTTGRADTLAGVNAFAEGMLAYERRAAEVLAAADADPETPLAQAYAAILWLLLEAPEAAARALPYLQAAERTADAATPREQAYVRLARAWLEDDIAVAERIGEAALRAFPRDLLLLKLLHYHAFNQGRFADMLRLAQGVEADNPANAHLQGMLAFGYEQCHLMAEAEAAARQALSLKAKEPWAQHALAHVMLTEGRIAEGAAFMEGAQAGWTGLNSFMETHLWWHFALFRLSQGRFDEALAMYDEHVWAVAKDYSQDQIGAVSLLARLELAGVEIGERWRDLGEHLVVRAGDVGQPFLSLQYLYGLARAGRPEADALIRAVEVRAEGAETPDRELWAEVVAPTARGLLAQARGRPAESVRALAPALPRLIGVGGSHAQRDLFDLIFLDALIAAGELGWAQQLLETRRRADPDGAPVNRALAHVYEALGLPRQAETARTRFCVAG